MRLTVCLALLAGVTYAQTMTEFGGAAAVGTVGGASGKKVNEGLTAIFEKVGQQTAKAASIDKTEKTPAEPAFELAPGVVRDENGGVPPPPPPAGRRGLMPPALPLAKLSLPEEVTDSFVASAPMLPPPPEMSRERLHDVAAGMSRADVLRMGAPAAKITMFENGHLSETYSYRQKGQRFGTVHLTDGAVANVELQ